MKIAITLLAALAPHLALADDVIRLLTTQDKDLQLPYGETRKIEFVCPWDASKKPAVLEFNGRIDTPNKDASSGGPVALLQIVLNDQVLMAEPRLLNKPLKSPRDPIVGSEVVWYTEPHWALMYCGSWTPPANEYTPERGSPVHFVLDVTDVLHSKGKNTLILTYHKVMVSIQTLAEYCRDQGLGDATVVLGEMQIRPRKDADVFQPLQGRE